MRAKRIVAPLIVCAGIATVLLVPARFLQAQTQSRSAEIRTLLAQNQFMSLHNRDDGGDRGDRGNNGDHGGRPEAPPPVYNPYPPGILPSDINSELARVQREVQGIENEALSQWGALGPVTYTGQPPIIQGNGYEAMRILGKLMNYDLNISPFRDVACASCHMPYAGFSGPIPSVNGLEYCYTCFT